jgi:hypothetical protein
LHTLESREIISKVATSDACMISVNEISIKWLNTGAIRNPTDSHELLSKINREIQDI